MTASSSTHTARASHPTIGPWVPSAALHFVFVAVAAGLCLVLLDSFWLPVGVLLAILGAAVPSRISPWWVLLLLGLSQLAREPSATDPRFYVLLAGLQVLHMLASFVMLVPGNGRIQLLAFVRPLRRFLLVQLGVQSMAAGALLLFQGDRGTIAGLSVIAAAMLGVVAVLLARGLRRG